MITNLAIFIIFIIKFHYFIIIIAKINLLVI